MSDDFYTVWSETVQKLIPFVDSMSSSAGDYANLYCNALWRDIRAIQLRYLPDIQVENDKFLQSVVERLRDNDVNPVNCSKDAAITLLKRLQFTVSIDPDQLQEEVNRKESKE